MNFKDMNSDYCARVVVIDVSRWSDDGEGDHVGSKDGFNIGRYDSLDNAMKGVIEYFGHEIYPHDCDGQFINVSLIEDENACPDENGEFIAHYTVIVERVQPVVFTTPN